MSRTNEIVNAKDLVDVLYRKFDGEYTKKDLTLFVDTFIDEIAAALESGKNVKLKNLGIFHLVTRAPREIVPPGKDKPVQVPAKKTVKFKLSAGLANSLN